MDLQAFLHDFGLTETEAKLYITALKRTHVSARELTKATELKRPAVYHALETLGKKGLISTLGKNKILRYRAEPPEQLKNILNRRALELASLQKKTDKVIPLFPTKTELPKGEAQVEFFRGQEGVKNLAEKSLHNKRKQLFAIVPSFAIFLEAITKEFAARYVEEKRNRDILTQSVWVEPLKNQKEFDKHLSDHTTFFREVRFAPKRMAEKYRSIILIWDDNVAIINTSAELFGVLITSEDYANSMRALWSILWSASTSSHLEN